MFFLYFEFKNYEKLGRNQFLYKENCIFEKILIPELVSKHFCMFFSQFFGFL